MESLQRANDYTWVGLYMFTWWLEFLVHSVRYVIAIPLCWVALVVLVHNTEFTFVWATIVAYFPLVWSLLAFYNPVGTAWLFRNVTGGRRPSGREELIYEDALAILAQAAPTALAPREWFVVDDPAPGAAVVGRTLMLTRGMLEHPDLPAVIAHELGHLNSIDGRLTAALNRLVLRYDPIGPPKYHPQFILRPLIRLVFMLAGGGIGLRLTRPAWGAWWRQRELAADRYAHQLGQGPALAEFLEHNALLYDQPIPFLWATGHTHPPTEHRLDQLSQADLYLEEPTQ